MRFTRCSQSCPVMFMYSDRDSMKWPVIYLAGKPGQRGISMFHAISHQANLLLFFAEIINVAHERNRGHAFFLNFERYLPLDIWIAKVPLHYEECTHLIDYYPAN